MPDQNSFIPLNGLSPINEEHSAEKHVRYISNTIAQYLDNNKTNVIEISNSCIETNTSPIYNDGNSAFRSDASQRNKSSEKEVEIEAVDEMHVPLMILSSPDKNEFENSEISNTVILQTSPKHRNEDIGNIAHDNCTIKNNILIGNNENHEYENDEFHGIGIGNGNNTLRSFSASASASSSPSPSSHPSASTSFPSSFSTSTSSSSSFAPSKCPPLHYGPDVYDLIEVLHDAHIAHSSVLRNFENRYVRARTCIRVRTLRLQFTQLNCIKWHMSFLLFSSFLFSPVLLSFIIHESLVSHVYFLFIFSFFLSFFFLSFFSFFHILLHFFNC